MERYEVGRGGEEDRPAVLCQLFCSWIKHDSERELGDKNDLPLFWLEIEG